MTELVKLRKALEETAEWWRTSPKADRSISKAVYVALLEVAQTMAKTESKTSIERDLEK